MNKKEVDIEESEEENFSRKKTELLKQKVQRLKCPICGSPGRLRMKDGAIICREGGHITYPTGEVWMQGVETTITELRSEEIALYMDKENRR